MSFEINRNVVPAVAIAALLGSGAAVAGQGNETPSGAHYNLNLIGMDRYAEDPKNNGNGRRIFVPLYGKAQILLTEGDFDVLDYNGLDGEASFQLPAADADCDGYSDYSVFVRALGGGGSATMTTCLYDTDGEYCSSESVTLSPAKGSGKNSFSNVSKELLTVLYDIDDDGRLERTPLFGDDSYGYLWDYDNNGLRLAQLRFYDEATFIDVNPYDPTTEPDEYADYEANGYNCTPKGD